MVRVNERKLADTLNWHRATVARALDQLELMGRIRRWRRAGCAGIYIVLLDPVRKTEARGQHTSMKIGAPRS